MGQTTNQIEAHIEDTREDLGSKLDELERKVKSAVDWKQHFQKYPMPMLGTAFAGGILLATALSGRNGTIKRRFSTRAPGAEPWNYLMGALVSVATTYFSDFIGKTVPGFHERSTEKNHRRI